MIYVVLISYHRPQLLRRCIVSLEHLKPLDYRICVHVNGNDRLSSEIVQNFDPYLSLFSPERHTLSEARNHLLEKIKRDVDQADWILFLDDDAFLPQSYGLGAKNILTEAEMNKVDMIGGPNLAPPDSTFFSKLSSEWLASRFVSGWVSLRYKQGYKKIMDNDDGLILCHLWVKASALQNTQFHKFIQGGEENLFFEEFFQKGLRCYYDPNVFVFHERRENFQDFIRQIFKYGYGRGQVIYYSKRTRLMHLVPVFFLLYSGYIVFEAVSVKSIYLVPLFFYFLFLLFENIRITIKLKNPKALFGFLAIPIVHWTYALGLLLGLKKHKGKQ